MKTLWLTLVLTFSLNAAHAQTDFLNQSISYGKLNRGLDELDRATGKKWSQLQDWQKKQSWINEQVRLGVVGTVYEKGYFGSTVSRNVVPDKDKGWLVVDRIQVHAGPLLQVGNLAGNIFFQHIFPYVQVGADVSRTYVNVRSKRTYREALLASPFQFKRIPVHAASFSRFEKGEIVSTITSGGVFVRAGAGIFSLMGVTLAGGADIGPRAKIHINKNFKLTLARHSDSEVLVLVENATETGVGVGITTGLYIDNLIDAPVAIGINQANGYSPLRLNYKTKRENIRSIIYKINFRTREGARAYDRIMNRDLTVADDLADRGNRSVVREMVREGVVNTTEFNAGLDLIFYRSGFRNIFVEARYHSKLRGGKQFRYKEISAENVRESFWWWNDQQSSEKYSALVPTSGGRAVSDSFVLDTTFTYVDTQASGKDLHGMLHRLRGTVNHLPIDNVRIDPKRDYGQVTIALSVRFPAPAIRRILKTSEKELWRALAVSSGLADSHKWKSYKSRMKFVDEERDLTFDPFDNTRRDQSMRTSERMDVAIYVRDFVRTLKREKNPATQAYMLVNFLKDDERKVLHRTMIEIAGRDQLLIRGQIRGGHAKPKQLPYRQRAQ